MPKRNALALLYWICGEWLKSGIRVWESSARVSGIYIWIMFHFWVKYNPANVCLYIQCSNISLKFTVITPNHVLFLFSYKSCLPKSHRHDIQKRNRLDRFRIRNTLKRFLKKIGNCSVDECSLKLKYLIELAGIVPSLGSESFQVDFSASQSKSTFTLIRVTGETGIQTSGSCNPDSSLVRTRSS